MQERTITKFRTITELQSEIKKELDELQKKIDDYSKQVGEKLRSTEKEDPKEMEEFRTMLDDKDPKKKPVKKKDSKQWMEFQALSIYDGIGFKGELEVYFKTLEELKAKLEKLKKVEGSIEALISQGFRKDLGLLVVIGGDLSFRMVALKNTKRKAKFSYKTIFDVEAENPIAV
ncbi:MAG: hypothetical protein KGI10_08870 [Thaumarchaeota archaeon]|nr:hypothetical protein [Nitrososphaerota archaeon]